MDKTKLAIVGAIAALAAMPMTASAASLAAPETTPVALHGGILQDAAWVWVGHRRHWHHGHYRHYGYGYGWHRHWRHHHRW